MQVDWLVVGAGFTGATFAERVASQLHQRVLVIDRRRHIGGNAYDEYNADGLLVSRYGPHIFHTSSSRVWHYLSGFTTWRPYMHRVLGLIHGCYVPIPFNLTSLHALLPSRTAHEMEHALLDTYGFDARVPILRLRERPELKALADFIYTNVFLGYTTKQWGMSPEHLDPSVTARVPVVLSKDDRYFQDPYQGIPTLGYSRLFSNMLSHENIWLMLNTSFADVAREIEYGHLLYTGALDELLGHAHGVLPYRSIDFQFQTLRQHTYQSVGTVNYPNDYEYTRITEQKHLTGQDSPLTTLVTEYPIAHVPGDTEPYYPIPQAAQRHTYDAYLHHAHDHFAGKALVAGRLADYRYYNMDQAVARALKLFDDVASEVRGR